MTILRHHRLDTLIQEMPAIERRLIARRSFILIIWPCNHRKIAAARRLVTKGLLTEEAVYSVALAFTLTDSGQKVYKRLGYEVLS